MKKMKRLAALFLAIVMVMAMGMTAAAKTVSVNEKSDQNPASITITNAKKGITYKVYKVFNATETGSDEEAKIAYTLLSGAGAPPEATGFYVDGSGNVKATNEEQEELNATQVAALKTYAEGLNQVVASGEAEGEELVFSYLPYGYYMVIRDAMGEANAAVSIDSTTPNMVIFDKNPSSPGPNPGTKVKQADNKLVAVGENAYYTVEFATVNYETKEVEDNPETEEVESGVETTKISQYTIEDIAKGGFLDRITVDSVKVYENGKDQPATEITPAPQFTNGVMTIDWTSDGTTDGTHLYKEGSILEIKYHGTVNNNIVAGAANTNSVRISWNGSTEPIDDDEDIYTGSITIDKVNGSEDGAKLADATFVLLDTAVPSEGTGAGVIPANTKYYTVAANGAIGTADVSALIKTDGNYNWPDTAKVTTDSNGAANFKGLEPGKKYYLLEVEAPTGFNRLVGTTEVEIGSVRATGTDEEIAADVAALAHTPIPVVNNAGAVLPSTGGIGTTIFYVVGGILVLGAAVLLITKKRMSTRN